MKINLLLQQAAAGKMYEALNVYTKGDLLCIEFYQGNKRVVHKYPLCNVFRVEQEYE